MWERILTEAFIVSLLASTIRTSSPILVAALGEIYSERAGVLNIGLEGQMLMGALFGFLGAYYFGNHWLGMLTGILAGGLIALILAFMCVSLYANQVVTGVTINLLCLGLSTYFYRALFGVSMTVPSIEPMQIIHLPWFSDLPLVGPILFQQKIFVYITFLLTVIAAFFLYRTTVGLEVRAVGEYPAAAETTGVNVYKTRYLCIVLSGLLAGLGGAILSVGEVGSFTQNMSAGRGFMALAIVIFGGWGPIRALGASLLFGAADSLQLSLQALGAEVPPELLLSIPYALTVLIMAVAAGHSRAPASLAVPYVKE
jgi:simple sugar transport system permease protein